MAAEMVVMAAAAAQYPVARALLVLQVPDLVRVQAAAAAVVVRPVLLSVYSAVALLLRVQPVHLARPVRPAQVVVPALSQVVSSQ